MTRMIFRLNSPVTNAQMGMGLGVIVTALGWIIWAVV